MLQLTVLYSGGHVGDVVFIKMILLARDTVNFKDIQFSFTLRFLNLMR